MIVSAAELAAAGAATDGAVDVDAEPLHRAAQPSRADGHDDPTGSTCRSGATRSRCS